MQAINHGDQDKHLPVSEKIASENPFNEKCVPFQLLQQSGDATVIKNFAHEGNSKVVF